MNPEPTTNPLPVDPVRVNDQVLLTLPVKVFPVDIMPVLVEPEKLFVSQSVILTILLSCDPFDNGTVPFF